MIEQLSSQFLFTVFQILKNLYKLSKNFESWSQNKDQLETFIGIVNKNSRFADL